MKMNNIKAMVALGVLALASTSCENGDWDFPDFEYSTTYFAYQGEQNPIRTITLGEDPEYDTKLDNNHQCQIIATMGGVYDNKNDVIIQIAVDNALCDGMKFKGTDQPVVAMPSNYYKLAANQIVIPKGKVIGGVTVQLTDDFFNDPKATELNYVIPVKMVSAVGVDSILSGKPKEGIENPSITNLGDWDVAPKNYVLYAVKYISKYQSNYLRRGVDNYADGRTVVRHAGFVEKDEVVLNQFKTLGINSVQWDRPAKDNAGNNIDCLLKLDFDGNGTCTVSSNVEGVTATGTGQYADKGDKNSWGGKDRDVLYLDYTVEYSGIKCATKDTLVVRDRGVKSDWFAFEK